MLWWPFFPLSKPSNSKLVLEMAFQKTRWRPYKYILQIGQILASSIGNWGTEAWQRKSTQRHKNLKLRRRPAFKRYFLKELLELSHLTLAILKTDRYPDEECSVWLLQNIYQVRCFYQIPFLTARGAMLKRRQKFHKRHRDDGWLQRNTVFQTQ